MKQPEIHIKRLSRENVAAVAEIERQCFSAPWSLASLQSEILNPLAVFRVAEIDGAAAGYVGMHHVVDEGYITNVAVLPQFRRHGVAIALIRDLIAYGNGNGLLTITLEVRDSNVGAQKLYSKLDFAVVGRRKGFYHDPDEDAVLMTLTL